jgi:DNA ligase D-like protein (predicted 3'-phosphoesterase)
MALDEYRKKRKFNKTPEPSGEKKVKPSEKPIFVVQKHDATNLHYDFRLQINDVLKSWAVPKGISTKTGIKRLAIQTEDHPLAYADFEGVIPEGEYGAGTVEIWDKGEYENLREKKEKISMQDCWENGKIEIKLFGEKFNGNYVLIQTKREQGKHWLIFKT